MLRSPKVFLLLCALTSACSFVADFDRGRIGGDNTGGTDGSVDGSVDGGDGDMDASSMDASADAAQTDAAAPDAARDAAPTPECTTHEDCDADELCCDNECVDTSFESRCESCGAGCNGELAAACVNRTCVCEPGSGQACSGVGDESYCESAQDKDPVCVACRDSDDCTAGGMTHCLNNVCVECNPANNSGCSGDMPICNSAGKCEKCSTTPDNCPGDLVCTPSGACGGCASSMADCDGSPRSPICDASTTQCRACANDGECSTHWSRPFCANEQCSVCDPDTEAGCNGASKTPDCRLNTTTDEYECQACRNDTDCDHLPANRRRCEKTGDAAGSCVECVTDAHCSADPKRPLCQNNTCVACDADIVPEDERHSRCDAKEGNEACVTTGTHKGECGPCDPNSHAGCEIPQPFCSASLTCVQCLGSASCGNQVCSDGSCMACADNAQCSGHPMGGQCVSGGCRACDPANDAGCTNPNLPQCRPSDFTCVQCLSNDDCGGATPICDASNQCVACTDSGQCADNAAAPHCATTGTQAGACVPCTSDAHCTTDAAPLCHNNACVPCNTSGISQTDADTRCGDNRVCVTAAGPGQGQCRACDPAGDRGCSQPNDQCLPDSYTCVDCIGDDGCTDGVCITGGHTCVECNGNADCASTPSTPVCAGNACVQCNGHADCASTPNTPFCAGNACRACMNDDECTMQLGADALCGSNGACRLDAECMGDEDCAPDTRHPACVDTANGKRCR